jgi:hypothetical protein
MIVPALYAKSQSTKGRKPTKRPHCPSRPPDHTRPHRRRWLRSRRHMRVGFGCRYGRRRAGSL